MQEASAQDLPPSRPRIQLRPRDGWFLLLAAAVVGLDQLAKWFIRLNLDRGDSWDLSRVVRIVHATNSGAAFDMLQDAGPLLVVTSIIGIAAIVIFLFNPGFAHPLMRAGLALMLGGAIGNLIDRIAYGQVVDFLLFHAYGWSYPAFNVADSAITVGAALLIIESFVPRNPAQGKV